MKNIKILLLIFVFSIVCLSTFVLADFGSSDCSTDRNDYIIYDNGDINVSPSDYWEGLADSSLSYNDTSVPTFDGTKYLDFLRRTTGAYRINFSKDYNTSRNLTISFVLMKNDTKSGASFGFNFRNLAGSFFQPMGTDISNNLRYRNASAFKNYPDQSNDNEWANVTYKYHHYHILYNHFYQLNNQNFQNLLKQKYLNKLY